MRNKKQNKGQAVPKTANKAKPKPKTPFGDVGAIVGRTAGNMFGFGKAATGVGRWLGTGIGSIFGSGDYSLNGPQPKYNVLTNGSQIPKFTTSLASNIVCHREYLGDITGTTNFSNNSYPLNPGIATTFPWLSSIAANYQEYKFHGIIFEFRPLITDFVTSGAPGVVIMATNYNASAPVYVSKQAMENSEFAVAVKPTLGLIHGVECAVGQTVLQQQYIRTGSVPSGQDQRLYDLGTFQFATQQNPNQDLGELWVSYCVEFFKPVLPADVGGVTSSSKFIRSATTNANPFGTLQINSTGNLGATAIGTSLQWYANSGSQWLVTVYWNAAVGVAFVPPSFTTVGLTFAQVWNNNANNSASAPNNGVTANQAMIEFKMVCNLVNPGLVSILQSAPGVVPAGNCDIVITELDASVF